MNLKTQVDEEQLLALAGRLARVWREADGPGICLFLRGDLGAGKTTFSRGFITGCGYEGIVKSPTYTLVEPYKVTGHNVYHFDLYRLSDPEELEFTGARDYFGSDAACLVEWPEQAQAMLPMADIECQLSVQGALRDIELTAHTVIGEQLMLALQSD